MLTLGLNTMYALDNVNKPKVSIFCKVLGCYSHATCNLHFTPSGLRILFLY